jgi:hypothetical protein
MIVVHQRSVTLGADRLAALRFIFVLLFRKIRAGLSARKVNAGEITGNNCIVRYFSRDRRIRDAIHRMASHKAMNAVTHVKPIEHL